MTVISSREQELLHCKKVWSELSLREKRAALLPLGLSLATLCLGIPALRDMGRLDGAALAPAILPLVLGNTFLALATLRRLRAKVDVILASNGLLLLYLIQVFSLWICFLSLRGAPLEIGGACLGALGLFVPHLLLLFWANRDLARRGEIWVALLIFCVIGYLPAIVALNEAWDNSRPELSRVQVVALRSGASKGGPVYTADVVPLPKHPAPVAISLPYSVYRNATLGSELELKLRSGAFHDLWLEHVSLTGAKDTVAPSVLDRAKEASDAENAADADLTAGILILLFLVAPLVFAFTFVCCDRCGKWRPKWGHRCEVNSP